MACHVAADEPPAIPTIQELRAHDKPPTIPTVQELSRARQTPRHLYRRRAPCGRRALRHQQAPDLCAAERTNHQFFCSIKKETSKIMLIFGWGSEEAYHTEGS
uniref:Uncharacterized protein n=1 Tax=Triticum urartu TaxID=4572 RepID=A0A8R7R0H4_TRIUA